MKRFLMMAAMFGLCAMSPAYASGPMDMKTKQTKEANSAAQSEATATASAGDMSMGEGMQEKPSPKLTKWITSMKACHKGGKANQKCHNRVMKKCESKLTKMECSKIMSQLNSESSAPKM